MTILVTGATGNIGRLVVDHLAARTDEPVRALTVDPERAALPAGVEAVRGSVRRPASLDGVFDGVRAMYLAPYEDTAAEVLAAAAAAGVGHVVALTGEKDSWWGSVTEAVEAAGPAWTHLWPADFVENYEMWLPQVRDTGAVREPWPELASTPTAMTDIAEVAAVALTEPGYEGRALELTGPERVSRRDATAAIAAATGVPIRFEEVTPDAAVAALEPSVGRDTAEMVVHTIIGGMLGGADPTPNAVVQDVTGRPGTTVRAWALAHADRLRAAIT